ncbi:MAG: hypothetical protein NVSMB22_18840 [Chloroflexota bacterium]
MFNVESIIARFRTAAGAHWDYSRAVRAARSARAIRQYSGLRGIRIGALGQERDALGFYETARHRIAVVDVIRFRRGAFRITLKAESLTGVRNTRSIDTFIARLAMEVDRRARRAR